MDIELRKLGLNEKEISVYLTVLEYGKVLPATIARVTKINRTTVYAVSKELIRKGLIIEDVANKTNYLVAMPVNRLVSMIEKEERIIRDKKKIAEEVVEDLSKITSKSKYSPPKISFIEESGIEDFLYTQMSKWALSVKNGDAVWGFQDHSFAEHFEKWIIWAAKEYELDIKLLSNKSFIEQKITKKNLKNRNIQFYLPNADFSTSLWVAGQFVIMIQTREKPFYLVEMYDSPLAYNLKEVFKNIWEENISHGNDVKDVE